MVDRYPLVTKNGQPAQIPPNDTLKLRGPINEAAPGTTVISGTLQFTEVQANTVTFTGGGVAQVTNAVDLPAGSRRTAVFAVTGTYTLRHDPALFILPTAANIVIRQGDVAEFLSFGDFAWRCVSYTRADGTALAASAGADPTKLPLAGGTMAGAINEAPIVQASLLTDGNRLRPDRDPANTIQVSTAGYGLSSIFTMPSGTTRRVILNDFTITHSSTLQLIGSANIVAKLGDVADFISLGGGTWVMTSYTRKDGTALVSSGGGSGPASTDALPEGTTNLYFTGARTIASLLVGFTSSVGTVTAADSVLTALGKLQGTKVDAVAGKGLSTNDYTTTEQTKLAGIASGATANATDANLRDRATHTGTQPISTVTSLQATLDIKVDKVTGFGLSSNDYTSAEKAKLAGLDGNHFRGTFATFAAMTSGVTSPVAGDYADVDPGTGTDALRYIWDANDAKWTGGGASTSLTAAQVKTLYESNADTNAYTNAEKSKLGGVAAGAQVNTVTSVAGKTGVITLVKADVGLADVDNTADSAKPISTLQAAAINAKEPTIAGSTATNYWNGLKGWSDFAGSVRAALLTGLDLTVSTAVEAGDTVLAGIGKLQKQITDLAALLAAKANLSGATFTGKIIGTLLSMAGYLDKTVTNAAATGTVTLDLSAGSVFDLTLTGNTTLAFSNVPTLTGETYCVLVRARQGGTAYTLTQPSGTTPITSGGAVPATPAANKIAEYIYSTANGTAWNLYAGPST
jgi:hypothetical protein